MVPSNVKYLFVYPAYVVVLGPSQDVTKPQMWQHPQWDGKLFPCNSRIEMGLRAVSDVPQLPETCELTRDFLPLKQAPAPLWKWTKGVRQLLLWVGHSRPSENRPSQRRPSKLKFGRPWRRRRRW